MSDRVPVDGGELEYEVQGCGEPVLLIHGSHLADALTPLLAQPALAEHYRLIHYHRRGFAGSCQHAGPCAIAQQAADARALLDHLGVECAHVVGHSYGGTIALQLALDAPERVASLALLEPAGIATPSGEVFMQEVLVPSGERYARGDKAGAIELFLLGVCGPGMREVADQALPPGAVEQATADADTFFLAELPALGEWQFGPTEAARITQPTLLVLGSDSNAVTLTFSEMNAALAAWLPRAESVELPGTTHALQMMNPAGTAELLTAFFARHPMESSPQSDQPRRFDAAQGPRIVGPADGLAVDLGSVGVRFLVWGEESGGGFSLVEHPIPPRGLAAPLHRHAHEDEYSYVLEGRLGALLGDDVVFAEVGDLVFKPRQQWHTFWNAGDGPCRILEIISPGGFEQVFAEMASDPEAMSGDSDAAAAMDRRYGVEVDYESVARLCQEHDLVFLE